MDYDIPENPTSILRAPSSRRLRHIISVSCRTLSHSSLTSLPTTFFTIHKLSDGDPIIYISNRVSLSLNPSWEPIEHELIADNVDILRSVCIKVWNVRTDNVTTSVIPCTVSKLKSVSDPVSWNEIAPSIISVTNISNKSQYYSTFTANDSTLLFSTIVDFSKLVHVHPNLIQHELPSNT
jgi:hypothetical protein